VSFSSRNPVLCQYFAISPRVVVDRVWFHIIDPSARSSGSVSTDSAGCLSVSPLSDTRDRLSRRCRRRRRRQRRHWTKIIALHGPEITRARARDKVNLSGISLSFVLLSKARYKQSKR